ncbi:MAG: hypothetical protein AAGF94_12010, partial [Pseudomonadota bacterium]
MSVIELEQRLLGTGFFTVALERWRNFKRRGKVMAMADLVATLWLSGRLFGARQVAAAVLAVILIAPESHAEDAVSATAETTLGYVLTGNSRVDAISQQA